MNRPDTPLAPTPEPNYSKLTGTTAKDTANYKKGFSDAVEGKQRLLPKKSRVQGFREAEQKGLRKK